MTIPPTPRHIIALGRAYIRLIEAAEHIAESCEVDAEAKRLRAIVRKYKKGLGQLVATLPAHVVAEIMVASDKVLGPVNEQGTN